jgi:hypothetical protein
MDPQPLDLTPLQNYVLLRAFVLAVAAQARQKSHLDIAVFHQVSLTNLYDKGRFAAEQLQEEFMLAPSPDEVQDVVFDLRAAGLVSLPQELGPGLQDFMARLGEVPALATPKGCDLIYNHLDGLFDFTPWPASGIEA